MAARTENYKTLIEAVERYVTTSKFPKVETICAILGIEHNPEEKEGDSGE